MYADQSLMGQGARRMLSNFALVREIFGTENCIRLVPLAQGKAFL